MLSRARRQAQRSQSKPNLTYFGFACQVWVLSMTFLGSEGGLGRFRVSASKIALWRRICVKIGVDNA